MNANLAATKGNFNRLQESTVNKINLQAFLFASKIIATLYSVLNERSSSMESFERKRLFWLF